MSLALHVLAVIGLFCLACSLVLTAAMAYESLMDRRRARRSVPAPPADPSDDALIAAADRAFLASFGIDPTRTAERPYDHEREGL